MALIKRADVRDPNSNVVPLAVYTSGSPAGATFPNAVRYEGGLIFVTDTGGSPSLGSLAFSNGTSWINLTSGAVVGSPTG